MLKNIAPNAAPGTTARARRLRCDLSLPEVLLWQIFRSRPHGLMFRKQHPSGPWVLDFYCSDARIAIEVDGAGHRAADRGKRDEVRDAWFKAHGIATSRIAASVVLAEPAAAAQTIVDACRARLPLHHPAAPGGPPPRDELGED